MKAGTEKSNFLNPVTWQAIQGYAKALQSELGKFNHELEREFSLLMENNKKDEFNINGSTVSLSRFTLMLGIRLYKQPHFGIRTLGLLREETLPHMKREIIEVENFLLLVPGVAMPPTPELLKEWLRKVEI